MKFNVQKNALIHVLNWAQSICPTRSSTPSLSHVLFQAQKDHIKVTATDLDMMLCCSLPADITESGEFIVHTRFLNDIIRKMPENQTLAFSKTEAQKSLSIQAGTIQFAVPTFSERFLLPKVSDMPHSMSIPLQEFLYLLQRTSFAMSHNTADYVLNGLCLNTQLSDEPASLQAMASNRHKLALAEVPLPDKADTLPSIIIPRKAILEMLKILDQSKDVNINVSCSLAQISIQTESMTFSSRLVSGTFPIYDINVPRSNPHSLRLPTKPFLEIIDRVATVYYQEATPWLEFAISGRTLTLRCENTNAGKAEETLPISYEGPPLTLCYHARDFLEILNNIRSDHTEILIANNPDIPIFIQGVGENSIYLMMQLLRNKLANA